jgi:hypothetical protein
MGVENSPGHPEEETGARMERLLSQFEGGEAHSTFNLIGTLIESSIMHDGETVEGIARSPQHLAKTVLLQKLPDLVDRELLAGAIEKKYIYREPEEKPNDGSTPEKVSKWMERYLEAEKTYDKQMDQGLTYKPFIELAKTHEKAWIIVDFITKLDDAVVAEGKGVNSPDGLEEIKRQVAESQEQAKREIQERAWNIYASCEVSFHDENARGLVLPLKQFAESIIYDDLDQHEQIKRLDRLSAELKKALT